MGTQRRSATKQDAPAAATVQPRPAAPAPPRPAKTASDRAKADPTPPSAFATRSAAIRRLLLDTWAEMKKINWPDQQTTRNLTIVVIGISAILGVLLGGIDFLLLKLLERL